MYNMPSSVSSSHGGQATLVDGRPPSPAMSTTTTLSPPSPVIEGEGGGKHNHHSSIIAHDAMADVKSKIEKLANELKQQQMQPSNDNNNSNNNTRPILPHLNTDSIITSNTAKTTTLTRPVLSPFSLAKSYQLQQHGHYPSTPGLVIPGLEPASRSLADLHNERSYLIHSLQAQGERATRLYQRYAHLEVKKDALASASSPLDENSANVSVGSKKKKIKKDLSLLRSRIAESTQQEQLIMLRLGEIHVELVNRGRWVMTHQHQQQHQQQQHHMVYSPMSAVVEGQRGYFGRNLQWHQQQNHGGGGGIPATPCSADSYYSDSPVVGDDYLDTPSVLSPLSPSFVPGGGVSFFEDIWTRPSQQDSQTSLGENLAPAPAPEQGHEHHCAAEGEGQEEKEEEEDDQTPKPKPCLQDLPLDSPAVPLSAVTPKFSTTITTTSTGSTVSTLPSEHLATPITPSRIPWDEYPSDSEDDGSFEGFDGSGFTPIGVTTINPLTCISPLRDGSGSGSASGVMVSEPEEGHYDEQDKEGEEGEEEKEEEEAQGSDESASEPGDLLSEQQKRTASFSRVYDGWTKGNNNIRRLSMPSLKNLWPAALAAVGVQMGLGEEEEELPEMRLDTVI